MSRVERARKKKEKHPTEKAAQTHIEASKEVFVFVHLLELVENMTEEIADLRNIISSVAHEDELVESAISGAPTMFSSKKKSYPN